MDRRLSSIRDALYAQFYESPYLVEPRRVVIKARTFEIVVDVDRNLEALPVAAFRGEMSDDQVRRFDRADSLTGNAITAALERGRQEAFRPW